jgi:hypothetical protein
MKQEIKDYILNNKIINEFISKVAFEFRGDFISHIWLILLEKDNRKIESLYDNGELGKYIIGVMQIQLKKTNSTFNQLWKPSNHIEPTDIYIEDKEYVEVDNRKKLKRIHQTINNVKPTDGVIFRLYYGIDNDGNLVEPKTYKEIEQITGYKYHTIRKSVLRTKAKI